MATKVVDALGFVYGVGAVGANGEVVLEGCSVLGDDQGASARAPWPASS